LVLRNLMDRAFDVSLCCLFSSKLLEGMMVDKKTELAVIKIQLANLAAFIQILTNRIVEIEKEESPDKPPLATYDYTAKLLKEIEENFNGR
jgi:hypothetical protein